MRTHSLYSQNEEKTIMFFEKFDKNSIKKAIIEHLTAHPEDTVEHCREYSKQDTKRFYGNEIINLYEINPKNGQPSKVVENNSRKKYLKLTNI